MRGDRSPLDFWFAMLMLLAACGWFVTWVVMVTRQRRRRELLSTWGMRLRIGASLIVPILYLIGLLRIGVASPLYAPDGLGTVVGWAAFLSLGVILWLLYDLGAVRVPTLRYFMGVRRRRAQYRRT